MNIENKDCKACVCTQCRLSDYQGAVYACSFKRCRKCEAGGVILKLSYCECSIPLKEKEPFTL